MDKHIVLNKDNKTISDIYEWCHGRTSQNRLVHFILFWQIKCETCGELFQSIINLLFHVEVSTLKQFILCVINILSDIKLLLVEPSRWCRFRNLSLLVKVTPAKVIEDRGSPRENSFSINFRTTMWKCVGISETRTLNKATSNIIFFCFGNIFNSFKCQVFVITLILMMSGALVGHQKTRTVQKFSFDK